MSALSVTLIRYCSDQMRSFGPLLEYLIYYNTFSYPRRNSLLNDRCIKLLGNPKKIKSSNKII